MNFVVRHIEALAFFLCLMQPAFLSAQEVEVSGTVRNDIESLEAASVSVMNKTVVTNKHGKFIVSVLPGIYIFTITHAGYSKMEQKVLVEAEHSSPLDFVMTPEGQLGEVVVLGSRSNARSNLNTAVPVDAFSQNTLRQTGQMSLTQMLNFVVPSFNASGETLNEPVTLRGLDPDHVLILLNGTRYHNMVWMNGGNLKGQLGRGSVGNDLNSIPLSAIAKVEVLRDGATAQYGSDAIAGIINIILKGSTGKTNATLQTGQFYKGDGEKFSFGINRGLVLNKKNNKGTLNLSGDFRYQAPTHRAGQYEGTVYYNIPANLLPMQRDSILNLDNQKVAARGFNRKAAVDQVGNSKFIVAGLLVSSAYPLSQYTEVFMTTVYNNRKVYREQAYRFPKNAAQVNLELFPDGYQPIAQNTTEDISLIAGAKGVFKKNTRWNFISSFGTNILSSYLTNTNNASQSYLVRKAPTSFYNGKMVYEQLTNNINFVKSFSSLPAFMNQLSFSGGIEYRVEKFYLKPGEEASWKNYDSTYLKQTGTGGTSPEEVIHKERNNTSIYIDLETELHKRLLFNVAMRKEYYSDFGENLAGKLAMRYRFSKYFSLRFSAGNGFRAPSLQQRYTSSVTEIRQNVGGVLFPSIRGIFPNDHAVVKALGVSSLTAEKSINLSGGCTSHFSKKISLTADVYWIQIRNRIVLSGMFLRNRNAALDHILDQFPEFNDVDQVAFFANAIHTRTMGADVIMQGNWNVNTWQLNFTLAANFTQTRLYGGIKTADNLPQDSVNTNSLLNLEEKVKIEKNQPPGKIILTLNYKKRKTGITVSNTRFDKTSIAPLVDVNRGIFLQENFSAKILTDVRVSYSITPSVVLSIGSNNIFNVYPDKIKHYENTSQGIRIYSPESTSFGYNGGYYFMNMLVDF